MREKERETGTEVNIMRDRIERDRRGDKQKKRELNRKSATEREKDGTK